MIARSPFESNEAHVLSVDVDAETGTCTVTLDAGLEEGPDPAEWDINGTPGNSTTFGSEGDTTFSFTTGESELAAGAIGWTGAGITFFPPGPTLPPGSIAYP